MQREFSALDCNENVKKALYFDPTLWSVSTSDREDWDHMIFPLLWSRILKLELALQNAKPWNFWVLFRDRPEKLPFWTFLSVFYAMNSCFIADLKRFATMILVLTCLQVALGVAQVVAGFNG